MYVVYPFVRTFAANEEVVLHLRLDGNSPNLAAYRSIIRFVSLEHSSRR